MNISVERLRESVSYDPETGIFIWLRSTRNGVRAGDRAGRVTHQGYREIVIDRHVYSEHRLAWFYVHGQWPAGPLDHVNVVRNDNRITNLRLTTPSLNCANQLPRVRAVKGITLHQSGRWQAQIKKGRNYYLGLFDTAEEAAMAYHKKAIELFGEFARSAA